MICDKKGMVLERNLINDELHAALSIVQTTTQAIPADIIVSEKFNIHRSFRRGATTRAKEQGVGEATIEMNNRWRKVQNCQGGLPNLPQCHSFMLKFREL